MTLISHILHNKEFETFFKKNRLNIFDAGAEVLIPFHKIAAEIMKVYGFQPGAFQIRVLRKLGGYVGTNVQPLPKDNIAPPSLS